MISSQAKCATARCRAGYSPALAGLRPARWQECHRGRQKCLRHVGPKMAKLQKPGYARRTRDLRSREEPAESRLRAELPAPR